MTTNTHRVWEEEKTSQGAVPIFTTRQATDLTIETVDTFPFQITRILLLPPATTNRHRRPPKNRGTKRGKSRGKGTKKFVHQPVRVSELSNCVEVETRCRLIQEGGIGAREGRGGTAKGQEAVKKAD